MRLFTRRTVLVSAALAGFTGAAVARNRAAPRVVALDWTLAATLMALGVTPVGVAEQALYRDWVGAPAIPEGVAELGLRTGPSFETVALLKPDLILVNALNAGIRERLETIAPTFANTIYTAERAPLERCRAMTRALGERVGQPAEAEALIRATEAHLAAARTRLDGMAWPPLLPLNILDAQHINIYGRGSLYADVLAALGLTSAFAGPTSLWGNVTAGIETTAALPRCDRLVIAPVPPAARRMLQAPGLWSSLLAAQGGRAILLPPAWAFGDLTAASRFAGILAEALLADRSRRDRDG